MKRGCLGTILLGLCAALLALTTWCCVLPPVVPIPPVPSTLANLRVEVCEGDCAADDKIPGATVTLRDGTAVPIVLIADGAGNASATLLPGVWRVQVEAEGFRPWEGTAGLQSGGSTVVRAELTRAVVQRRGLVRRLQGWSVADDDGPFLGHGVTLFWGLWGYQHDRARLVANLHWLAETRALDYVRVLATVCGASWADRRVDPREAGYDAALAGFTDLAYDSFGLRVQWTIFGDTYCTPTPVDREALVDRVLAMSRGREQKILLIETANEAWQNGFEGTAGLAELRALTRRLQAVTDILIASSAGEPDWTCAAYAGGVGDLATVHLDRDTSKVDGPWRPVRQPWGVWGEYPCLGLPPASSNEPIGPYSSVAEDRDPTRLLSQIVVAHLAGLPLSVIHAGPGIRGGGAADAAYGRPANLWETEHLAETLAGLAALRALLPPDLASWTKHNSNVPEAPFAVDVLWPDGGDHGAVRVYAAKRDSETVTLALGIKGYVVLTARWPMTVARYSLPAGTLVETRTLATGETWRLEEGSGAWLLQGRAR